MQNQQRPTQNKRSSMQNQHLSFFSKILQNVHRSLRRFICEIIYYNSGTYSAKQVDETVLPLPSFIMQKWSASECIVIHVPLGGEQTLNRFSEGAPKVYDHFKINIDIVLFKVKTNVKTGGKSIVLPNLSKAFAAPSPRNINTTRIALNFHVAYKRGQNSIGISF